MNEWNDKLKKLYNRAFFSDFIYIYICNTAKKELITMFDKWPGATLKRKENWEKPKSDF